MLSNAFFICKIVSIFCLRDFAKMSDSMVVILEITLYPSHSIGKREKLFRVELYNVCYETFTSLPKCPTENLDVVSSLHTSLNRNFPYKRLPIILDRLSE